MTFPLYTRGLREAGSRPPSIPEHVAAIFNRNVRRGAAWLEEMGVDWVTMIDPSTLDMSDSGMCLLGQTGDVVVSVLHDQLHDDEWQEINGEFSGYFKVVHAMGTLAPNSWLASDYGFDMPQRDRLGFDEHMGVRQDMWLENELWVMLRLAWLSLAAEREAEWEAQYDEVMTTVIDDMDRESQREPVLA